MAFDFEFGGESLDLLSVQQQSGRIAEETVLPFQARGPPTERVTQKVQKRTVSRTTRTEKPIRLPCSDSKVRSFRFVMLGYLLIFDCIFRSMTLTTTYLTTVRLSGNSQASSRKSSPSPKSNRSYNV